MALGRTLGSTLGADPEKRARRRRRRERAVAPIAKRPGTRGKYTGREQGSDRDEMERYAAQPKELGTLPERIWMKFLDDEGVEYTFQQAVGDVRFKGAGNLVDFFLPTIGNRGTVISVVGLYWHLLTFERDSEMYARMTSKGLRVVSSYEDEIYREALAGNFENYAREKMYGPAEPPVRITLQRVKNVL